MRQTPLAREANYAARAVMYNMYGKYSAVILRSTLLGSRGRPPGIMCLAARGASGRARYWRETRSRFAGSPFAKFGLTSDLPAARSGRLAKGAWGRPLAREAKRGFKP